MESEGKEKFNNFFTRKVKLIFLFMLTFIMLATGILMLNLFRKQCSYFDESSGETVKIDSKVQADGEVYYFSAGTGGTVNYSSYTIPTNYDDGGAKISSNTVIVYKVNVGGRSTAGRTVTATANSGYAFSSWSESGKSYTANFVVSIVYRTITVEVNNNYMGTIKNQSSGTATTSFSVRVPNGYVYYVSGSNWFTQGYSYYIDAYA